MGGFRNGWSPGARMTSRLTRPRSGWRGGAVSMTSFVFVRRGKRRWNVRDWLYWLGPGERQWFWWDGFATGESEAKIVVEVTGRPTALGALARLFGRGNPAV